MRVCARGMLVESRFIGANNYKGVRNYGFSRINPSEDEALSLEFSERGVNGRTRHKLLLLNYVLFINLYNALFSSRGKFCLTMKHGFMASQ